jgi:hypothetical protein
VQAVKEQAAKEKDVDHERWEASRLQAEKEKEVENERWEARLLQEVRDEAEQRVQKVRDEAAENLQAEMEKAVASKQVVRDEAEQQVQKVKQQAVVDLLVQTKKVLQEAQNTHILNTNLNTQQWKRALEEQRELSICEFVAKKSSAEAKPECEQALLLCDLLKKARQKIVGAPTNEKPLPKLPPKISDCPSMPQLQQLWKSCLGPSSYALLINDLQGVALYQGPFYSEMPESTGCQ